LQKPVRRRGGKRTVARPLETRRAAFSPPPRHPVGCGRREKKKTGALYAIPAPGGGEPGPGRGTRHGHLGGVSGKPDRDGGSSFESGENFLFRPLAGLFHKKKTAAPGPVGARKPRPVVRLAPLPGGREKRSRGGRPTTFWGPDPGFHQRDSRNLGPGGGGEGFEVFFGGRLESTGPVGRETGGPGCYQGPC